MLAKAAVFWRPDWDWRILFQSGSFMQLVNWCWPLAGSLSFSPSEPLQWAIWISLWHCWFSPKELREKAGSCNAFYDLISEATHHHFYHILFSQNSSDSVWEKTLQKCEHQGRGKDHWKACWVLATTTNSHQHWVRILFISLYSHQYAICNIVRLDNF